MTSHNTSKSEDLLRRVRAGESRALERLFARYIPRLRRWAHGRVPAWAKDGVDTEDLVQDTILETYKRLEHFEPRRDGALIGYLRRSLINRIRDRFRVTARRPSLEPLDDQHPDEADSPLTLAICTENQECYRRALARLREPDRYAIVARLELGYSYEQLALVLAKPTAEAARLAVRRALFRLAEEMRRA